MNLSDAFSAIAVKQLVRVDIPNRGSRQHELNGSKPLRRFFKTADRLRAAITWHYFSDSHEVLGDNGTITFYDSRRNVAHRSAEWRGYYTGDFLSRAKPGDILVLAKTHEGALHGLIFEAGSNWLRSVMVLLSLTEFPQLYTVLDKEALDETELRVAEQLILDALGFSVPIIAPANDQELMVRTFGKKIPNTKTLAEFARKESEVDERDADSTLMRWIERETTLFYAIERVLVQEQIDRGFKSVEDFLEYSISIQQSRRSRMGLSLQHHLNALFEANRLRFTAQARTEGKNRPDFLFPGEAEYHNAEFDNALLVMLGAKSTVKERWRQILTEADRIQEKHLCTLEPAISGDQTREMQRQHIQLVVPRAVLRTYSEEQRTYLLTLNDFIEFVRSKHNQETVDKPQLQRLMSKEIPSTDN